MTRFVQALIVLTLLGCVAAAVAKDRPDAVVHAPQGDFQKSIARVAFGSDGQLFAAYRIQTSRAKTAAIRALSIDPLKGKITIERSYPAPATALPRVVDDLLLSPDGGALVYAELHGPEFIAAFHPPTLEIVASSTLQLFAAQDLMRRLSGVTQNSIILSSERHEPNAGVRLIALNLSNLGHVDEDSTFPFPRDEGRNYGIDVSGNALWLGQGPSWFKHDVKTGNLLSQMHAREDVSSLVVSEHKLFGLTDKKLAGWIQVFDRVSIT